METAEARQPCLIVLCLLLLCQAVTARPAGAQGTLDLETGVTLAYPGGWAPGPLTYANASELVASGGAARLLASHEQRSDHAEALRRLVQIARERDPRPVIATICGWPGLQRVYRAAMEQPGIGSDGDSTAPLSTRLTTAVAVGSMLVRLQGFVRPDGASGLPDEIAAMSMKLACPPPPDPAAVENEIQSLRNAVKSPAPMRKVAPRRSRSKVAAVPPSSAQGSAAAVVGAPQQIQNGVGELELAVSTNGQFVVMAANSGYSYSSDGGLTFTNVAGGTPNPGFNRNGDPSLAFAVSGNFYYAFIGFPSATQCASTLARSTDNGQTFPFRSNAFVCNDNAGPTCFTDQEHIAADRFNAAPGGGDQVYVTWRNFVGGNCNAIAGPEQPTLVCSSDGGSTWSAQTLVNGGTGIYPRISVGQDGSVYVVYRNGGNIMLDKYSSCSSGLALQAGFPATVTAVTDVPCAVPGLDRCNSGNILSSHMVAVDDTNANHVYIAYATNTAAGNENVMVIDSTDGGVTWPNPAVAVNTATTGVRFMPWVCTEGGAARVSWYDRRAGAAGPTNDLTDYYCGSAAPGPGGALVAGTETNVSNNPDPHCASGWPCAPRSTNDSESCTTQPQLAGVCRANCASPAASDSQIRCDFSDGGCPAGESCCTGGGCPKYGDYSGNACAAGRIFNAWSSASAPPGLPAPGGLAIFFDSKLAVAAPDLGITKTDSPDPVTAGTDLTYTVEATNYGPASALNVAWSDPLPAGTTFVSVLDPGGWTCASVAGTVGCTAPFLGVGAFSTFILTVHVDPSVADGASLSNTASVSSQDADPVPANDSATTLTSVIAVADLSITKTAAPDYAVVGSVLFFEVDVSNAGPSDAANPVFTDVLPAKTVFHSIVAPAGWNCTTPAVGSGGTVTCTAATLPFGGTASFTIRVIVNVAGGTVDNTVQFTSDTTDPASAGNTAATSTPIVTGAPLLSGLGLLAVFAVFLLVALRVLPRRRVRGVR